MDRRKERLIEHLNSQYSVLSLQYSKSFSLDDMSSTDSAKAIFLQPCMIKTLQYSGFFFSLVDCFLRPATDQRFPPWEDLQGVNLSLSAMPTVANQFSNDNCERFVLIIE